MRPKKLYHGTSQCNVSSICKIGLKRGIFKNADSSYIYTTAKIEEAQKWGKVVFAIDIIDSDNLRNFEGENPIWQILIMNDIPPERLTLIRS